MGGNSLVSEVDDGAHYTLKIAPHDVHAWNCDGAERDEAFEARGGTLYRFPTLEDTKEVLSEFLRLAL